MSDVSLKKGWCPTLTKPMESGDGLLVRIHLPQGNIDSITARAVAALSTQYGNGQIDLTSRGNLQIRGVAPQDYETLLQALISLGITDEPRPARQKNSEIRPALGFKDSTLALGLLFGRLTAPALTWLADHSANGNIGLSTQRTIYLHNIAPADAAALLEAAHNMGFITKTNDARRFIEACPGAPSCKSAHGDTRTLALAIAEALPRLNHTVHVSGCSKGCACPAKASRMITARNGNYTMAFDATADTMPLMTSLSAASVIQILLSSPSPLEGEGGVGGISPRSHVLRDSPLPSMVKKQHPDVVFSTIEPLPQGVREYIRNGDDIYRKSFAIIRAEADLARFDAIEEKVAVRIIHACGIVETAKDILFSPGMVARARIALQNGAPILCDAKMVASGITRKRLPASNEIICMLDDPRVPALAKEISNTRSAAAMELWRDKMAGAVIAIGNAPTSLFRLLEMLDAGAPLPAAVIGMPVGFVGAAESKEALMQDGRMPYAVVRGRKGGSAMTVAAINAIAHEPEI